MHGHTAEVQVVERAAIASRRRRHGWTSPTARTRQPKRSPDWRRGIVRMSGGIHPLGRERRAEEGGNENKCVGVRNGGHGRLSSSGTCSEPGSRTGLVHGRGLPVTPGMLVLWPTCGIDALSRAVAGREPRVTGPEILHGPARGPCVANGATGLHVPVHVAARRGEGDSARAVGYAWQRILAPEKLRPFSLPRGVEHSSRPPEGPHAQLLGSFEPVGVPPSGSRPRQSGLLPRGVAVSSRPGNPAVLPREERRFSGSCSCVPERFGFGFAPSRRAVKASIFSAWGAKWCARRCLRSQRMYTGPRQVSTR